MAVRVIGKGQWGKSSGAMAEGQGHFGKGSGARAVGQVQYQMHTYKHTFLTLNRVF